MAAISNAGGFGVIACGSMDPARLAQEIEGTYALTGRPFGVNLITMHPQLEELIDVCADLKVQHVVLAGGLPPSAAVRKIKDSGAKAICFAPALVYRAGPAENPDEPQSIELGAAVMAALDFHASNRLAGSVCRHGVELARAAISAIAVDEFARLHCPFDVGHGIPPLAALMLRERNIRIEGTRRSTGNNHPAASDRGKSGD